MRITVIGSADAFNARGRGHSCYLIDSPGAGRVLLDCGATALLGLRRAAIAPASLDGVLLTHLHGDHIGGFPFLAIDALFNAVRDRELPVLGPLHTQSTLQTLMRTTYGDLAERLDRFPFRFDELAPDHSGTFLGYRVEGFAAKHMKPPHAPLCLRVIDPQGRCAAFSGDTEFCPGLFEAADGADLLVAECTELVPTGSHHCSFTDWQQAFGSLTCKRLLLSHLGAEVRERAPLMAAANPPAVPLQFADDGLVIDL